MDFASRPRTGPARCHECGQPASRPQWRRYDPSGPTYIPLCPSCDQIARMRLNAEDALDDAAWNIQQAHTALSGGVRQ